MQFELHEVVPETCNRTVMGRVVINPPNVMGALARRLTGTIYMCCNRAFLSEESYKNHAKEKKDHIKVVNISKLPAPELEDVNEITDDEDSSDENLWVKNEGFKNERKKMRLSDQEKKRSATHTGGEEKHSRKEKQCPLCNVNTGTGNLSRHMRICHVPEGIKCDYCSCTFLWNRGRLRHQKSLHGALMRNKSSTKVKKAIVERAKKQLISTSKSKTLLNKRSKDEKESVCTVCGKDFGKFKTLLIDHMNTHTGARPYKCDICGYRFSHSSNLSRHKRTSHTKNDKAFCTICNCSFSNNKTLARHNKSMHPDKLRIKKLDSPDLKLPRTNFSDDKDKSSQKPMAIEKTPSIKLECPSQNSLGMYECDICQKQLSSSQTWRGHMLIHQDLKPYKCKICGMSFRLHGTRSNHVLNSHSGGKFKCSECPCCFKNVLALQRHKTLYHKKDKKDNIIEVSQRSPSKVMPSKEQNVCTESSQKTENVAGFKCNLCGTVVKLMSDFQVHKRLHNGANRSQCNLCLKKFGSSVNVKIHKKRAHGDATLHLHACMFCCCRYKASQALFSHLMKEHGMKREDWDFQKKSVKPEARRRIQLTMCDFNTKSERAEPDAESDDRSVENTAELQKLHECEICHQKFKLLRSISNHKKIAHKHGTYVCGICPCRYHKLTWLKKHQLKVHGYLKIPKIKNASGEASKRKVLTSSSIPSTKPKLSENLIECTLCKLKFRDRCLEVHKKKSHFHSGKFRCDHCPCKFQKMQGLLCHLTLYHGRVSTKKQRVINKLSSSRNVGHDEENKRSSHNADGADNSEQVGVNGISRNLPSKNKFECDLCHMKFSHRSTISSHKKKSHFHSGKFKCSKCTCKFMTAAGLLNHKKVFHRLIGKKAMKLLAKNGNKGKEEGTEDSTLLTSKSASKPTTLDEQISENLAEDSNRIECNLCHLIVGVRQIARHRTTSHDGGAYPCPDCACVFKMPQGLTRHQVVYHRPKQTDNDGESMQEAKENETGASKSSKVNLNFLKIRSSPSVRQSASKNSTTPQKDSGRGSSKSVTSSLKSDNKSSNKNKNDIDLYPTNPPKPSTAAVNYKFKCEVCGIRFTHTMYLRRHKKKAHIEGGISCSACSCTFVNAGALAAHRRIYHSPSVGAEIGSKSLKKSVKSKLVFEDVETTTVGKRIRKPVLQSVADDDLDTDVIEQGTTSTNRKTRLITRCKKVEESTSSESTLQSKSDNPTDEKSSAQNSTQHHQCMWCPKTFSNKKLLDKHILSHTRPELCQKCGMGFRNKDEVTKHMKVAHDPKCMHECDICTCRFGTAVGLKAHHTAIHKKQSASYANIEIEHDEGSIVDNEPFINVTSVYSQQNISDGFCEDSEPIIQGILETNYSPDELDDYGNQGVFQEEFEQEASELQGEIEHYEDSVPIVEGVLEYTDSEVVFHKTLPPPAGDPKKKPYSPKSRPMKCSICKATCYGPDELRLHTQSYHQENQDDEMSVDESDANVLETQCRKCGHDFKTNADLIKHIEMEHDESGFYKCAYCSCIMKNETNLRYHFMRVHSLGGA